MNITKNTKKIAERVLINESKAIQNLINFIDNDFEACVAEILNCKGRVVITGIGKSAIIANKIVATLNSTGTPALFMHAADAIHGDLGMIQSDDIVMCLSRSGNSPEIKVLVPLLKRRGSRLIGMVSNRDSYLATQADHVLFAAFEEEACPNNLAPTTSTAVQMAMGDALAVCLLEMRNFSSEDFAALHPGGSLGKQLYLKVSDLIDKHSLPAVSPDASIKKVILEISSKRLGATAVLDDKNNLLGIITDGDLRRMLEANENFGNLSAENIMSKNPKRISVNEYAVKALSIMQQNSITQLVVVDGEKVIGFVHMHDLLREGIV